jgi:phage/plasmid-associated DNA primase
MIDGIYYDFDLKNAQPEIIRNLCESNKIPCPNIKKYCEDRNSILQQVQDNYKVNRDTAKELFIRLCFYGSYEGWCISNKIFGKSPLDFITNFERELNDIAMRAKKVNPTLYETARKKKEDGGDNKENKIMGSFFALFNQEYESRIVEAVMCYLINQTDLLKVKGTETPTGAYEYDGIKLLKTNVDNYEGGINGVIELLNKKTKELTGFNLEWANKPYEELFDITEWIKEVEKNESPNDELFADMEIISKAIGDNDCGMIETIQKILPNHFIYSVDKIEGGKGEWYGWNGNRWEKSVAPLKSAILYDIEKYWKNIMNKWDDIYGLLELEDNKDNLNYMLWAKTRDAMYDKIWKLKSASGVSSCVSIAETLLRNDKLEFDTNVDLFGCENGVIDIENECFRPYRFDDYITFSCGYDFTPYLLGFKVFIGEEEVMEEDKKVIKPIYRQITAEDNDEKFTSSFKLIMDIYEKIFPDAELRNYFFKILSTGMSGRAIEKFFIFNGGGRNGKGLSIENMGKVLGTYYESVSPIIFSEIKKNSGGANPELAKIHKKRMVSCKEPAKDSPLQNSTIKDMTGGGTMSGRMLYSSKTIIMLFLTLIMECNEKPPFSEAPKDADAERICDILFGSKFCNNEEEWDTTTGEINHIYPLDAGLKEQLKQSLIHRNTMLNILLQNLIMVKEQNYNTDFFKPESVKKRSLAYLQNSYDIHNIFTNLFEKRNEENANKYLNYKEDKSDDDWTLSKIAQHIRKSKDFIELPKMKQREYKAEIIVEFFNKNNFYKSSIYKNSHTKQMLMENWRLKPEEDEEDD